MTIAVDMGRKATKTKKKKKTKKNNDRAKRQPDLLKS